MYTNNKLYKSISYTTRQMKRKKSRKMGSRFFPIYFGDWISFTLSQNANLVLILGHLWIINIYIEKLRRINRYLKERNIESKVVSPSQLYIHVATYRFKACNFVRKMFGKDTQQKIFWNCRKSYLAEPMQKNDCGGIGFNQIVW